MLRHKFLFLCLFSFFSVALLFGAGRAMAIAPLPPVSNIFGQSQYYSVVFDEEGEAAVAAKLVLQNSSLNELSKVKIEIPGTNIRLIRAVQEAYEKEQYCIGWKQVCTDEESNGKCLKYEKKCASWHWRPKTWQPIYYTLEPQIDELSNSVQYTFDLKAPIQEQGQGAILLYYKVPNYAKKSGSLFRFKFETIKIPYDVNMVRVAINVQEGLYLKGGAAATQYRPNNTSALKELTALEGVSSRSLSAFSQQITYARGYVKITSGLDPWESFKVEGIYAKSRFALYRWQVLGSIFGTLALIAGIGGLLWWLIKRSGKKSASQSRKKAKANLLPLKIIGAGTGSAVAVIVLLILSFLLIGWINYHISYRYQTLPLLLIMLIAALFVLVIVFGPALYFGVKYGPAKGLWTLATTIVALMVISGIIMLFYMLFFAKPNYPIYPMREAMPMNLK